MVFSNQGKVVITEVLHQEKAYGVKKFISEFSNGNWCLSSLNKLRTKLNQTGRGLLWIANPVVVKSVRCGLLLAFIQLRSWYLSRKCTGHSQNDSSDSIDWNSQNVSA